MRRDQVSDVDTTPTPFEQAPSSCHVQAQWACRPRTDQKGEAAWVLLHSRLVCRGCCTCVAPSSGLPFGISSLRTSEPAPAHDPMSKQLIGEQALVKTCNLSLSSFRPCRVAFCLKLQQMTVWRSEQHRSCAFLVPAHWGAWQHPSDPLESFQARH